MSHVNATTFTIVVALFILVTGIGFAASRWRTARDMMQLNEWGLAGRGFGTFITWFLLGGDLYTAYTFIAVPALVYASGSIGFYAAAYTIMAYPIAFIFLPRLWSVSRVHNYVTPADFIRGRYGSRGLALSAAVTGILASLPYIALQLVGIQAVLSVMGVGSTSSNTYLRDLPLFIAFIVLAVYTYLAGLRAPAAISFVKDTLIYVFVLVAVFYIPTRLGGWSHIFGVAQAHYAAINPATKKPNGTFIPTTKKTGSTQFDFATLALGSALALFVYPHVITGALAARRRSVIKRNMSLLPAYSVLLGLIALFGYMAIADPVTVANVKKAGNSQLAVPYLLQHMFPSWFTGVAFAGIIIGALVPAAIMSIGAANLFTRNIFREFFKPDASPRLETQVSRWTSLVVKLGALYFAVELPHTFSINLQLLGGIWILQTFPMLVGGLYTRWFHRWALLPGWLAGMIAGTLAAYNTATPTTAHWASSSDILFGFTIYIGISAFVLNLAIAVIVTLVLRALRVPEGTDETLPHQYTADPEQAPAPVLAGAGIQGGATPATGATPD
ncbi:MAG TPA: sodium:solute symporter [Trebonia sp.]|jgi:SSS family solute:Na+ symporter|nr:sodium:solute symporter [Trebonia sp.]